MKKMCELIGAFFVLSILTACAREMPETPSDFSAAPSGPSLAISSSAGDVSVTNSGSEMISSDDTNLNTAEPALRFYDSFRDIPFVDIEYCTCSEDGSIYKGSLDKNGRAWCSAPGMMEFGERCFTDGTKLWIQVYQYPDEDFDWYQVCFDHFHNEDSILIDAPQSSADEWITQNKLFTYADGYTVYTDDGFSFTVEPCSQ